MFSGRYINQQISISWLSPIIARISAIWLLAVYRSCFFWLCKYSPNSNIGPLRHYTSASLFTIITNTIWGLLSDCHILSYSLKNIDQMAELLEFWYVPLVYCIVLNIYKNFPENTKVKKIRNAMLIFLDYGPLDCTLKPLMLFWLYKYPPHLLYANLDEIIKVWAFHSIKEVNEAQARSWLSAKKGFKIPGRKSRNHLTSLWYASISWNDQNYNTLKAPPMSILSLREAPTLVMGLFTIPNS